MGDGENQAWVILPVLGAKKEQGWFRAKSENPDPAGLPAYKGKGNGLESKVEHRKKKPSALGPFL